MSKSKRVHVCRHCGAQSSAWAGRCSRCGEWGGLEEQTEPRGRGSARSLLRSEPLRLAEIDISEQPRIPTGIGELDRVLGGGLVPASAVLVGGEPGIGKSTLMLQAAHALASRGHPALYVTGEESPAQLRLRAERLDLDGDGELLVLAATDLEEIVAHLERRLPELVILDSIQMVHRSEAPGGPGSITQVRECSAELVACAKRLGFALLVVGHVTKDGAIAGPKILEHLVDVVLYFETAGQHPYRILRVVKNRFGPTDEIGVFEMQNRGLLDVENPSSVFLHDSFDGRSGSVIVPALEGTRVLLVEVQSLVSRAAFGPPRIKVTGVDASRVSMLMAVLEKRAGVLLSDQDVHVNVAGGLRINEPAADLSIALSCASSFLDRGLERGMIVAAEVGLGGELRAVHRTSARLKEARKLGFKKALIAADPAKPEERPDDLEVITARTLREAVELLAVL